MTPGKAIASAALTLLPLAAAAFTPEMPETAVIAAQQRSELSSVAIPVGPFDGEAVPALTVDGAVRREVWQRPLNGQTTLQLLAPLKEQLLARGYEVILDCASEDCGGFDFRFATDTLPEPEMHVDLGDFRFLSAFRPRGAAPDYVTLMVSRSASRGFLQITQVGPAAEGGADKTERSAPVAEPAAAGTLAERLERDGHAVLDALDFATGSADLDPQKTAALSALADYLRAHQDRAVVLVGHTDAVGALAGNIALSRKRAEAVRRYLVETLGVADGQITAEGVGYLAPRASNLTEAGHTQNRRVEAVLMTAE